ncbi:MAG: glycosyltransferase family 1 protein [Bacteroidales bacterium]|jgi:glycosyltransferase involved in cell wall biosynthesis
MHRIAIYIDSRENYGGAFQYSKAWINALNSLSSEDLSITALYTSKRWKEYLDKFPGIECVFIKKLQIFKKLYQFLISIGLINLVRFIADKIDSEIKFINARNFDIIIFPASDTIACLVRSKVIGTIHDLMHRYERRFKESGSYFVYKYREHYFKRLLILSKIVLVDSGLGKEHIIASYKKIKAGIYVLSFIAPDYIYSNHADAFPGSDISDISLKYIFYPAQFWPHKNHYNLLRALKILRDKGTVIMLLFSGNKELEYKRLVKFVKDNDLERQVKFHGYIPESEIVAFYQNALAMVMPTFFGPTNIPPVEAILLGCPPIVSDIYGMPSQLEDAALYFNPNNPEEIADRIESIIKQTGLRENLIANGLKIRENFSQDRFKNDIKGILSRVLDNK